jgi:hypothetical protein
MSRDGFPPSSLLAGFRLQLARHDTVSMVARAALAINKSLVGRA